MSAPTKPIDIGAVFARAAALHSQGQLKEAASLYRKILAAEPANFDAGHMMGLVRAQQGRYVEAAEALATALRAGPPTAEALSNYGNILKILGHLEEALMSHEAALSLSQTAVFWFNRGLVLMDLRRFEDAVASHDSALSLAPNYREAMVSRAAALLELGRFGDAVTSADAAIRLKADMPDAFQIRGVAQWRLQRFAAALDSFNLALALAPQSPALLNNKGMALCGLERFEDAVAGFDAALALEPGYAEALVNRGVALASLHRYDEALGSFDKALALQPNYIDALNNKGGMLTGLERFDEALACYAAALKLDAANSDALYNSAAALARLNRFEEALSRFDATLSSGPWHPYALSGLADAALNLCDWRRTETLTARLAADVRDGRSVVSPFTLLGYSGDKQLQLRCAKTHLKNHGAECRDSAPRAAAHQHDKIRIAYVSSDFGNHPVSHQLVELLERHDRSQFEIHGISLGADDGSEMRARMVKVFDSFEDVRLMQDRNVADLMRRQGIDIAVDLNGHTQNGRPAIFAYRAAPVQVNYLGYPATSGSVCMDYILADAVVAPFGDQSAYSEAIVHLPESFFVQDSRRATGACSSRQNAGLPLQGLVFCCFNQNWKIAAPLFDVWMRLLSAVPGSILWLRASNDAARANLRREAEVRGIDPDRLVFADSTGLDQHMSRLQLADIFLDTLPYNAHATACDALWAGVPVVTCKGEAFAGRVAASLLRAAGLPELVTGTLADYEVLALKLARDPSALASVREKLARNKASAPLFDADRTRKAIETAYRHMLDVAKRGAQPAGFSVTQAGDVQPAAADQLVS